MLLKTNPYQKSLLARVFPEVFFRGIKIVKAERSGKMKTKFSILTLPRRILSYEKIVKAERSGKMKTKFSILTRPRRLLSYKKIVKAERDGTRDHRLQKGCHRSWLYGAGKRKAGGFASGLSLARADPCGTPAARNCYTKPCCTKYSAI